MRLEADGRPPAQTARGRIAAAPAVLMKSLRVKGDNGLEPDGKDFMMASTNSSDWAGFSQTLLPVAGSE
jgi:hypothetical protein